jgi:hypothetical protein
MEIRRKSGSLFMRNLIVGVRVQTKFL